MNIDEYKWVAPLEVTEKPLSELLEEIIMTMKKYPFLFEKIKRS